MRRVSWSYQTLALLLLLPLLLPLLVGFAAGPGMSEDEALQAASSDPEVEKLLSQPIIEASANYDQSSDFWHVVLTDEDVQARVAELWVADDTGEAENVEIFAPAEALDAIEAAAADPEVRQELAKHDPPAYAYAYSDADAELEEGQWTIQFGVEEGGEGGGVSDEAYGKEVVVVAQIGLDEAVQPRYVWTGDKIGWQMARGGYDYGRQANYRLVWGLMGFVFALAFAHLDKLLHIRNLDVLALLGFLLSQGFFKAADPYWAVLLWYPSLLYLLARTLLMGFGIGERVEKTSNFPTPVLFVLAAFASGFVLSLNLDSGVLDVGHAGVAGADRILNGISPYGNMPTEIEMGDTYGPLNYLLYIPFFWILGWSAAYKYLLGTHALTALAFVVGALAMLFAGRKYAGARGAAALLFAWTVFPYTLYATNQNSNDIVIGTVAALGLLAATSPLARGVVVGAGFAIKLFPLILAPLWMLHDFNRRRLTPILKFVLGGLVVFLLSFWVLLLGEDPVENAKLFYERTFVIQGTRESPFTIFGQFPALAVVQRPLAVATILLALLIAVVPKKRTIRRLAAFSAALTIAFELTLLHWFYLYVVWFEPFVFLALLLATNEKTALDGEKSAKRAAERYPQEEANPEYSADRKEGSSP